EPLDLFLMDLAKRARCRRLDVEHAERAPIPPRSNRYIQLAAGRVCLSGDKDIAPSWTLDIINPLALSGMERAASDTLCAIELCIGNVKEAAVGVPIELVASHARCLPFFCLVPSTQKQEADRNVRTVNQGARGDEQPMDERPLRSWFGTGAEGLLKHIM